MKGLDCTQTSFRAVPFGAEMPLLTRPVSASYRHPTDSGCPGNIAELSYCPSCRLQCVQLEDIVIGWCGEEELLLACRAVITGTLQPQCPFKVQELTHKVEVWGNVGLFPLDKVICIV